jgi:hypothetical protein
VAESARIDEAAPAPTPAASPTSALESAPAAVTPPSAASAPPPPWPDALAPIAKAIEGALAIGARAVGRLSAQANGIRFGNVQKQEDGLRAELRAVRREAGAPDADVDAFAAKLRTLLEQVERFAGHWIASTASIAKPAAAPAPAPKSAPTPSAVEAAPVQGDETATPAEATSMPDGEAPTPAEESATPAEANATPAEATIAQVPAPASTPSPAPLAVQQVAALRQGVTRSMVVLAQAPLHLRLEFGSGFSDPQPDVLLLAARMHAIHRVVKGTLRQVSWQAPDRAELVFGEGEQARTVEAVFDEHGKLQVPDALRQDSGRGATPKGAPGGPQPAGARGGAAGDRRGRDRRGAQPQGGAPAGRPQQGAQDGRPRPVGPDGRPQPGGADGRPRPGGPDGRPRQGASTGRPQPGATGGRPQQGAPAGRPPPAAGGERAQDAQRRPQPDRGPRPPGRGRPDGRGGPPSPGGQQRPPRRDRPNDAAGRNDPNAPRPQGAPASMRDDRRPPKPRNPVNSLMADKLRAVLGGAVGPKSSPANDESPAPGVPEAPPERGSD